MDRERLEKMIAEAKNEINDIERRIVALTVRRNSLWKYVESSRDVLAGDVPLLDELRPTASMMKASPTISAALGANIPASRIWEAVAVVMGNERRPITVPEIAELLEKNKIVVGGDHPQENIRSAMARKDDVFEKVGRGLYALKDWPEDIKQKRRGEPLFDVA